MKILYHLSQRKILFFLICILILNLAFIDNFSIAASSDLVEEVDPRNIPAKLSNISDELYTNLHNQRKFLDFKNVSEDFQFLNDDIEEGLKWKQIAVFQYFLPDKGSAIAMDPFRISEGDKNQYGIILTNNTNVLIVFIGGEKKEEWDFPEYLSFYDSVRLYDVYPDNPKMKYARHFFNITDSYSYVNQSLLYKSTVGLLNPMDWVRWYSSANMHEKVLYAALSCQEEVFNMVDQYINNMPSVSKVSLMGYRVGAGISTIFSCLLYQKLNEKEKLRNQNDFESEKVSLSLDVLNFESPEVLNESSIKIFRSKIGWKNLKNILSPKDQRFAELLDETHREVLYKRNETESQV